MQAVLTNLRRLYQHVVSGGTIDADDIGHNIVLLEQATLDDDIVYDIQALLVEEGYMPVMPDEELGKGNYSVDTAPDSTIVVSIGPGLESYNTDPIKIEVQDNRITKIQT